MRLLYLYISIFLFCANINARFATIQDASSLTEMQNMNYKVLKDGSYSIAGETKIKILNQQARNDLAQYRINYSEYREKMTILEAKIITNGVSYNVDTKNIEDQPLASQGAGFDRNRQILIAFPNLEIGSEVYIKYTIEAKSPLKNHFDYFDMIATSSFINNFNLNIDSEIPLYIIINDPKNVLQVKESKLNKNYNINIRLTKPVCDLVVNENGVSNYKQITWLSISSENNWLNFAKQMAQKYERVIEEKLPSLFLEIVKKVQDIPNEIDQINQAIALLNEKIQYMGDWRSFEGALFPRDLQTIANSQIGDCKDFTVSLGAILKNLGYKTQASLIHRSSTPFINSLDVLPGFGVYNHAFLKAIDKNGKIYWLDPTNMIAMSQGIFADIANKSTLVLDSKNPLHTQTPQVDYSKSIINYEENMIFNKEDATISGSVWLVGSKASHLTGAKLSASDQMISDYLFGIISNKQLSQKDKKEISINSDLTSRIVSDIKVNYKYVTNILTKTNLGSAYRITNNAFGDILMDATDQILNLYIDSPCQYSLTTTLKDKKAQNLNKLNVEIDNKWIYYKLTCTQEGDDIKINKHYYNKVDIISSEELKTKEYKDFKENAINIDNMMLILE